MKLYTIYCSTGCTCCSYDNHYEGFFATREEAQAKVDQYRKGINNPVASQYSRYGNYSIEERDAEILPDGRVIVGDRVFESSAYIGKLGNEFYF